MRRSLIGLIALGLSVALVAPASAYKSKKGIEGGTIAGVVKFDGTPPAPMKLEVNKNPEVCGKKPIFDESLVVGEDGGIRWAVARLIDIKSGKKWSKKVWGKKKAVIDQNGCFFSPHVLLLKRKRSLTILNSDGLLHNFHSFTETNKGVNRAQPKFLKKMTLKGKKYFSKPEIFTVKCDVHSWMKGIVVVAKHPYYAVTGADGKFELTRVPPGEYKLEIWHETLGVSVQAVTVKANETATVAVRLKK